MPTKKKTRKQKTLNPVEVGDLIDNWQKLRADRLKLEKEVEAMRREERRLETAVGVELTRLRLPSASGEFGTATRKKETYPSVTDWNKLNKFILKTGALDLLQRRVTSQAWKDRVEQEGPIPGIKSESFDRVRLTSKRGGKA